MSKRSETVKKLHASMADRAIDIFRSPGAGTDADALCDLLCELLLWADRNVVDFDAELSGARHLCTSEAEPS